MSSFKIEGSGYGSKKNLDSLLKVNIGTGKKSWQKTPPGLPHTEQIIQVMAKMDSISTSALRTLNRFQEQNSNWEVKPQNSIFGRGCNQNHCCTCFTPSPCSLKLNPCGEVMIVYPYPFSLHRRIQSALSMYWTLQKRTLNMPIWTVSSAIEEKKMYVLDYLFFFFFLINYSHCIALSWLKCTSSLGSEIKSMNIGRTKENWRRVWCLKVSPIYFYFHLQK